MFVNVLFSLRIEVFFSSVRSFISSSFCWQLIVVLTVAVFSKLYTARWKKQLSIKHVIQSNTTRLQHFYRVFVYSENKKLIKRP